MRCRTLSVVLAELFSTDITASGLFGNMENDEVDATDNLPIGTGILLMYLKIEPYRRKIMLSCQFWDNKVRKYHLD